MLNRVSQLFFITIIFFITSCSDKKVEPKEYFNNVISQTDSAVSVFNSFIDGSTYFQVDSMNAAIVKIKNTIDEKAAILANMEDCNGDATLRISAISFVNQLKEVSNSEFKQMVKLCSDGISEDVKSSKIDSLASVMGLKVNMASKPFLKSQVEFASKNNMKLNFDYEIAPAMKQELDSNVIVK